MASQLIHDARGAQDVKAAAARYLKLVEWSDEDKCFVGTAPGLFFGGCHGPDERAVYSELVGIVEDVVEGLIAKGHELPPATAGKTYSGKFVVRVGADLHKKAAVKALSQGISLNQVVADAIAQD